MKRLSTAPEPGRALYNARMASYAKDPRCIAMADALVPLLRRACPEGADGYGGSYQVNLDDEEAVGLGGVEAMRKAARQLGWKVTTIGWIESQRHNEPPRTTSHHIG